MRAAVIQETGQDKLDVRTDVELADVGPGEVRVDIKATGVCHSDISAKNGILPQPAPCVLGHEGAGVVAEIGDGVTNVKVGDHVVVVWVPPCRNCRVCRNGQPNLCMEKTMSGMGKMRFSVGGDPYFGFSGTGTFSESLILDEEAVVVIPDDVPFEIGALIGCGVTTGVGAALNTAKVEPGANVAVIGAGGVGISVIQGARICGAAEIVAVDMVDQKLKWAKDFGASHAVTPEQLEEVKMDLTEGQGFDYVFEVVGKGAVIRQAYDLTRRGGTCVVVGAGAMDDMVQFSAFELFYMERKLLGSIYGSADVKLEFPRLLNLWKHGRLDLEGMITQKLPLEQVNEAFDALERGEVIRTVLTV